MGDIRRYLLYFVPKFGTAHIYINFEILISFCNEFCFEINDRILTKTYH